MNPIFVRFCWRTPPNSVEVLQKPGLQRGDFAAIHQASYTYIKQPEYITMKREMCQSSRYVTLQVLNLRSSNFLTRYAVNSFNVEKPFFFKAQDVPTETINTRRQRTQNVHMPASSGIQKCLATLQGILRGSNPVTYHICLSRSCANVWQS